MIGALQSAARAAARAVRHATAVQRFLGVAAIVLVAGLVARAIGTRPAGGASLDSSPVEGAIPAVTGGGHYGHLFASPAKPGDAFDYAFTWTEKAQSLFLSASALPEPDLVAHPKSGMRGEVRLTAMIPRDAHPVMLVEVRHVEALEGDPRSTEITALLAEDIARASGYLVFNPDGALQSIRFAEGTPATFTNFVQRLIGAILHARPEHPGDREVETSETTPFGVATTKYEVRGDRQLYRSRVAYTHIGGLPSRADLTEYTQELESGALFAFREDGALASVTGGETLKVTKTDTSSPAVDVEHGLSLKLGEGRHGEGETAPKHLGALATHVPWESTIDPAAERKAVEDRLEGLTGPALLSHLRAVAVLGDKAPDQLKFFNRATGLLKLHPEESTKFVELVHEKSMSYPGRAFALDILASAGNDVVQAALLQILRDPRTRALPEYFSLYQRVSLVRAPSDATVHFAEETFDRLHSAAAKDEAEDNLRTASVYTLGSVAGHMKETRRLEGAEKLCARIVEKMNIEEAKRAHTNAYIAALGNAAVPSQEPLLLRLSDDPVQDRRVAALNSLRKYDTPASKARVMGVLTAKLGAPNVDLPTQAEALRALSSMTPTHADVLRIADAIVKDTLHRDLYGETVPIFRKGKASLAEVGPALDLMFDRSRERDDGLQRRIDTLRAELSAGP